MEKHIFIPTREEFREIISDEVESLLERRIPEIIRRANRKDYITTKEFKELTAPIACSNISAKRKKFLLSRKAAASSTAPRTWRSSWTSVALR